jgi:hypothetical protein
MRRAARRTRKPPQPCSTAGRSRSAGRSPPRSADEALAAEAADWLDHRIRYVQPDDPVQHRPQVPAPASWRRGGQIWALALDTVPDEQILTHLAGQYPGPQPEGPEWLGIGARNTLEALALADDPTDADVTELPGALRYINRHTFGFETGQLKSRAEQAQHKILDQLITRHPETAAVAGPIPTRSTPRSGRPAPICTGCPFLDRTGRSACWRDAAPDFTEELETAEAAEAARQPATAAPDAAVPDAGTPSWSRSRFRLPQASGGGSAGGRWVGSDLIPIAQRAARITEQSRRRAQQPAPAVPRNTPAADRHQQTQSPQTPPAPGARLP